MSIRTRQDSKKAVLQQKRKHFMESHHHANINEDESYTFWYIASMFRDNDFVTEKDVIEFLKQDGITQEHIIHAMEELGLIEPSEGDPLPTT